MEKSELRLSHQKGHTDLCYDDTGRFIITSGSDGDIRIWNGINDDEPISHKIGEQAYAVAFAKSRFFVGSATNSVQAYKFPDGEADGIITRFTAQTNHISISPDGQTLAAGSSDFLIHVVNMASNLNHILQGHEAPILSVALDGNDQYLASTSCDGTLRVWNYKDQSCLVKFDVLPKSSEFSLSPTLARMCWNPEDGKQLIVPVNRELKVYNRGSWNEDSCLCHEQINDTLSISAFHPSAEYVAAASNDGSVFVWNWSTKALMHSIFHDSKMKICGLMWNPASPFEIAFTDSCGYVQTCYPKDQNKLVTNTYGGLPAEDDDEKIFNDNSNMSSGDEDSNIDVSQQIKDAFMDDEDSIGIDIGAIKASLEPKILGIEDQEEPSRPIGDKPQPQIVYNGPDVSKPQHIFQSGSTPANLLHRFMKWNSVGIIQSYNSEEEKSIDVEFHDTNTHHSLHINNVSNHVVADVSKEAVVLACDQEDDSNSKLVCNHFASWDSSKEWTIELDDNEEFQAICLGQGWLAAATNLRSIRLYTIGGIQREILSIPGDIVTIAGHEDLLAVVYHKAIGFSGDQVLAIIIYSVCEDIQPYKYPLDLPLSPKSTLAWLGFTDEGSPCHFDSSGILRILSGKTGFLWTQIINTREHTKGKSDHHFIVGVSEKSQHLRCIFCKGSRYPPTIPRPSVVILPLKLPYCEMTSEKSRLEEIFWKERLLSHSMDSVDENSLVHATNKTEKETLMKLFALSCKVDREFRASEVAALMKSQYALQLAIKYASRISKMSLAQKVGEIAEDRIYGQVSNTLKQSDDEPNNDTYVDRKQHSRSEVENEEKDIDISDVSNKFLGAADTSTLLSSPAVDSNSKKNPFKVNSVQENVHSLNSGVTAFDSVKKTTSGNRKLFGEKSNVAISTKKPVIKEKQTTLFKKQAVEKETNNSSSSTKKSGFNLWYDQNKDDLMVEHPNCGDLELMKFGIKKFKTLSSDEKEKWNNLNPESKKRKLEDDQVPKENSRQKLSAFTFKKES